MKPNIGMVLVKLPKEKGQTDTGIILVTDYEPEKYAPVHAEIAALPEFLRDGETGKHIPVNIKVGDTVFFPYLTILNAKECHNEGMYWEEGEGADKQAYAIIPYDVLLFAIWYLPVEGDEPVQQIQMLNGNLLCDPIYLDQRMEKIPGYGNILVKNETTPSGLILVADDSDILADVGEQRGWKEHNESECIIAAAPQDSGLTAGDRVMYSPESDIPLEYKGIQALEKKYFRMKIADILCKIVNDESVPIRDTLIIQCDPVKYTGKLILSETIQKKIQKGLTGTVMKVGESCKWVKEGDRVVYQFSPNTREILIEDDRCEIVTEDIVLCKINEGKPTV